MTFKFMSEDRMEVIAFLIFTGSVFQAGKAEGENRSSGKPWAIAVVSFIVMIAASINHF